MTFLNLLWGVRRGVGVNLKWNVHDAVVHVAFHSKTNVLVVCGRPPDPKNMSSKLALFEQGARIMDLVLQILEGIEKTLPIRTETLKKFSVYNHRTLSDRKNVYLIWNPKYSPCKVVGDFKLEHFLCPDDAGIFHIKRHFNVYWAFVSQRTAM
jgi:hypothetical protein